MQTVVASRLCVPRAQQRRGSSHRCRATKDDVELCREKVSTPKSYEGKSEKMYTVTFVGAGDEKVAVKMPEVRAHRFAALLARIPALNDSFVRLLRTLADS